MYTFLFMSIPLQKQSTKTAHKNKEMIARPKETRQSRDLHFDRCLNDNFPEKTTEIPNLFNTINLIGP